MNLYNKNGLIIWTEEDIIVRENAVKYLKSQLSKTLRGMNKAFSFHRCESPLLIPKGYINPEYSEEDVFLTGDFGLKPETTASSYLYALRLLNAHVGKEKPPLVVWQHSKSARREQDQPTKYMRLKEFYQLEFQIIFSASTRKDYYPDIVEAMRKSTANFLGSCEVEQSDRLPSYSTETMDLVHKGMEVCSISRREDFPKEGLKVIEVAFGTDRFVYHFGRGDV